jgi:hypothetical protein
MSCRGQIGIYAMVRFQLLDFFANIQLKRVDLVRFTEAEVKSNGLAGNQSSKKSQDDR